MAKLIYLIKSNVGQLSTQKEASVAVNGPATVLSIDQLDI